MSDVHSKGLKFFFYLEPQIQSFVHFYARKVLSVKWFNYGLELKMKITSDSFFYGEDMFQKINIWQMSPFKWF